MLLALRQASKAFLNQPLLQYRSLHHPRILSATPAKRFLSAPPPTKRFVDIHDIGPSDPKNFDVLITDLDNGLLYSDISKLAGVGFLEEASKEKANEVPSVLDGFVYGRNYRRILPCVLSTEGTARWVFFLVDSGAPMTYISEHVARAFGLDVDCAFPGPWDLKIAGHRHSVQLSPKNSHFTEISILGSDFCTLNQVNPWIEAARERRLKFYFGRNWKVVPEEAPRV